MQIDDNMVLEFSIGARSGNGKTFQLRVGDYPPAAIARILQYGTRLFNDMTGGSDTTVEQKITNVNDLLARFAAGDVGRAVRAQVDPAQHEARLWVRAWLRKHKPDLWAKIKNDEDLDARLDKVIADNGEAFIGPARAEVKRKEAERARMAKLDVTVSL